LTNRGDKALNSADIGAQPLFQRTRDLSHTLRRRSLSAEENGGEAALIVDPVESPLWFVDHYDPAKLKAVTKGDKKRLQRLAKEVNELTARLFPGS
jgi:hypothetical protein